MSLIQKSNKPFMPFAAAPIRPRENSQDCQTATRKDKLSPTAEETISDSSSTNRKLIDAIRMIQSTNKNNLY